MSGKHQILVADDDVDFCKVLVEGLEEDGRFTVTSAHTIAEAEERRTAHGAAFDAFLLDVDMPDGDGRDFCARLRKGGVQVPILMLTGLDAEVDVVRGLSAGADDYVTKPFRSAVLTARLRSQLRSFESSVHLKIRIGSYTFQPAEKLLNHTDRRKRIILTDKETTILRYLCRTPGQDVTRRTLLSEVWGYSSAVSTHTVETHIYRLRQKMEIDPTMPRLIRSRPGGYSIHPTADLAAC
ncbi:MAG: response regulator transcription factor [Janthinobacterium lividum]